MIQRLPPLRAIEAFVVVAETMSYGQAATTLNITKSAVSRRIQSLEADLGVALFKRLSKSLALTEDGDAYYRLTGPAFDALRTAGHTVRRKSRSRVLRIALPEAFASQWVIPRLPGFYQAYPDIELQLDSLGYFRSLDGDDIDVAIRVLREPIAGVLCEHLHDLVQFPVVSPALLLKKPLASLDDLRGHTLLHLKTMPSAWEQWLAVAGCSDHAPARSLHFDTMMLSIDAAASGLGVALGVEFLCQADLAAGRLVAPLAPRLEGRLATYFTCRKRDATRPLVRKFKNWLLDEIRVGHQTH